MVMPQQVEQTVKQKYAALILKRMPTQVQAQKIRVYMQHHAGRQTPVEAC